MAVSPSQKSSRIDNQFIRSTLLLFFPSHKFSYGTHYLSWHWSMTILLRYVVIRGNFQDCINKMLLNLRAGCTTRFTLHQLMHQSTTSNGPEIRCYLIVSTSHWQDQMTRVMGYWCPSTVLYIVGSRYYKFLQARNALLTIHE